MPAHGAAGGAHLTLDATGETLLMVTYAHDEHGCGRCAGQWGV
ncbi:MAG: hypothetical protein ACLP01_19325 [Solirubrobacteraceae bacterium]